MDAPPPPGARYDIRAVKSVREHSDATSSHRHRAVQFTPTFPISTLQGMPYSATELLDVAE